MPKVNWCQTPAGKREAAAAAFASELERLRRYNGVSQSEAAAAAGICLSTYHRKLKCPQSFTVEEIQQLSHLLHLNRYDSAKTVFMNLISS